MCSPDNCTHLWVNKNWNHRHYGLVASPHECTLLDHPVLPIFYETVIAHINLFLFRFLSLGYHSGSARHNPWWHHQMEAFSPLVALCAGNSLVTGEFPSQRPVMWSFDVFFDLCLNKRLSKQSWGWWFETPSHSLWRHCNAITVSLEKKIMYD